MFENNMENGSMLIHYMRLNKNLNGVYLLKTGQKLYNTTEIEPNNNSKTKTQI